MKVHIMSPFHGFITGFAAKLQLELGKNLTYRIRFKISIDIFVTLLARNDKV